MRCHVIWLHVLPFFYSICLHHRSVDKTGTDSGLTMKLKADSDRLYWAQTPVAGFRMLIHNNEEPPFPEDNSLMLSLGAYTFVGIQKVCKIYAVE